MSKKCYAIYIITKYTSFLLAYIVLRQFFISFIQLVSKVDDHDFFVCRNYFGHLQFDSHVVCGRDKQCFEVV